MIKLMDILTEGINVRKWIKAVDKGKDVVVYDKKGKRYNLQGGNNKEVQVTDHWEDAGRRNVHPEKTWQTLPLSKVKKIVIEGKLTEGKYTFKGQHLTMPGGEVSSIPKRNDRDRIIFQIKNEKFKLFNNGFDEFYLIGDRNDYYPKGKKDLLRFLNKHKAKYIGIGKR